MVLQPSREPQNLCERDSSKNSLLAHEETLLFTALVKMYKLAFIKQYTDYKLRSGVAYEYR